MWNDIHKFTHDCNPAACDSELCSFSYQKHECFREPVIIRLKAMCHIYRQVGQLSTEISGSWAHPCFNVAWKFYLRVWYMQFRPQTMVSKKDCFESEGSGNLDRKHE